MSLKCDFCCSDDVVENFLAKDGLMGTFGMVDHFSDGGWAACADCARLVRRKDFDGLERRIADEFCRKYNVELDLETAAAIHLSVEAFGKLRL